MATFAVATAKTSNLELRTNSLTTIKGESSFPTGSSVIPLAELGCGVFELTCGECGWSGEVQYCDGGLHGTLADFSARICAQACSGSSGGGSQPGVMKSN